MIPDPAFLSFEQWAQGILLEYPEAFVDYTPSQARWQAWVTSLREENDLFSDLPDPQLFADWRIYAKSACQIIG